MDTFEAIEKRRSVKNFDPSYKISQKEINMLLEAAILSPTSYNIQHWRFVIVKDKKIKEKIKEFSWNQQQVSDASLVIIICGDLKAWDREPERYWSNFPKNIQESFAKSIRDTYQNDEQFQRDEVLRSCGIAAQTIMLAAKALGYDSCPMIGFEQKKVSELINLPKDHIISMMVVVGKATKPASPRSGQLKLDQIVFENKF